MESGLVKPKGVGDIRYHMCPKDFTIDCIINPAFACPPSLSAKWEFGELEQLVVAAV